MRAQRPRSQDMTPEYRAWLIDLFAPLGDVSIKRVFGFDGLYLSETMFGLAVEECLYFKADEDSRKPYARENSTALTYVARSGENVVMSYWEIPERLYDEPEELVAWARRAHDVASRSPTAKRRQARKAKQVGTRRPVREKP
ncbi:MAG TPA: TfoX/Sxy family protein [Rhizomicrobium sp.]